jgi:hypothetical protein
MSTPIGPRFRISLEISALDDAARASLLAGIQKVAAQSVLAQLPAVATSLAALGTKMAALSSAIGAVAADNKQLKQDITVRDLARAAVDVEFDTLRTLVPNNATVGSDITGMGFTFLDPASMTRTRPDAPSEVLVRLERKPGRARVTVKELAGRKGHYVAESSPDPIGPATWSPLPGNGKQRIVTGPSGTKVWVRFAQVRYGLQSDWSVPVLVTLA